MSWIQPNITWHAKKQKNMMHNEEKCQCLKKMFKQKKRTNETNTKQQDGRFKLFFMNNHIQCKYPQLEVEIG